MFDRESHDVLCPKQSSRFFSRCQCELIYNIRMDEIHKRTSPAEELELNKKRWYYSGWKDALESVIDMLHDETCQCDVCKCVMSVYSELVVKGNS